MLRDRPAQAAAPGTRRLPSWLEPGGGAWEAAARAVGACPGNPSQAPNSQSFRLSRAVIFQHGREGALETGSSGEFRSPGGLITRIQCGGTTRQGSGPQGWWRKIWGLKRCRTRLQTESPEDLSPWGRPARRGFPERTPGGWLHLLLKLPTGQPQREAEDREQETGGGAEGRTEGTGHSPPLAPRE